MPSIFPIVVPQTAQCGVFINASGVYEVRWYGQRIASFATSSLARTFQQTLNAHLKRVMTAAPLWKDAYLVNFNNFLIAAAQGPPFNPTLPTSFTGAIDITVPP